MSELHLSRRRISLLAVIVGLSVSLGAQTTSRRAAALSSLVTYPGFYQGQLVVVRGTLATRDIPVLTSPSVDRSVPLIFKNTSPPDGLVELRATFWDIGRLQREDPHIESDGLSKLLPRGGEGDWPHPGEVLALVATDAVAVKTDSAAAPSIRLLALSPQDYAGKRVTLTGQFRGRNLYGDLPQGPGLSQWDFVLRAADAAIWITGQRPRGKGFNLNVDARMDTGHWLEVTGVVREGRGLVWIEAAQVVLGKPDTEFHVEAAPPPAMGPSPEVIFSDPQDGDIDVPLKKVIRLQFSRDINPDTLNGNVTWRYTASDSPATPELPPSTKVSAKYDRANRSAAIAIDADELGRFKNVVLQLSDGVKATDGATLKPWSITFTFGAQ